MDKLWVFELGEHLKIKIVVYMNDEHLQGVFAESLNLRINFKPDAGNVPVIRGQSLPDLYW